MRGWFASPGRSVGGKRTMVLLFAVAGLMALGLLVGACGGGTSVTTISVPTTAGASTSTTGATGAEVVMQNLAFDPATITIKVGDSVTWINEDSVDHTVVANNGSSRAIQSGMAPSSASPSTFRVRMPTTAVSIPR